MCVTSSTLRTWRAVVDNIRWRIVGVMFLPSIFENRCGDFRRSMWRLSKIDVSPFEDRRSMSRCVDLRRSMCRPSEIDVLTFEDRCVDLRRSMCRPSKIDGRCEIRLLYLLNPYCTEVWMTILESGWNLWVWLVGVVSRRWVWLVGGIYGYGYNV